MNPIDKLAWIYVKDRKVLFVRSHTSDVPYCPGGKREEGESDKQALIREIKEELNVDLVEHSIKYFETFTAQAHGKPEGVMVQITSFMADYEGELSPSNEIAEMQWVDSSDEPRLSKPGKLIIASLKAKDLIN